MTAPVCSICGDPLQYTLVSKGTWWWCWRCDGHRTDCSNKGKPFWKCSYCRMYKSAGTRPGK